MKLQQKIGKCFVKKSYKNVKYINIETFFSAWWKIRRNTLHFMQVSESRYFSIKFFKETKFYILFSKDCNVRHILLYISKFIKLLLIVFSFWIVYGIVFTIRCLFLTFARSFALGWQAYVVSFMSVSFQFQFNSLPKIPSVVNWMLRRYQRYCIHKVKQCICMNASIALRLRYSWKCSLQPFNEASKKFPLF